MHGGRERSDDRVRRQRSNRRSERSRGIAGVDLAAGLRHPSRWILRGRGNRRATASRMVTSVLVIGRTSGNTASRTASGPVSASPAPRGTSSTATNASDASTPLQEIEGDSCRKIEQRPFIGSPIAPQAPCRVGTARRAPRDAAAERAPQRADRRSPLGRPTSRREGEQRYRVRHLRDLVQRDEARRHESKTEEHRISSPDTDADDPAGKAPITPPTAHAMNPTATSCGRIRSVRCHVRRTTL